MSLNASTEKLILLNGLKKNVLQQVVFLAIHFDFGKVCFQELSSYALTSLITPASNATVERIFSLVTAVNTKLRDKTQIKLLDALVRIRSHLLDTGICCKEFVCSAHMLKLHNSDSLYGRTEEENRKYEKADYMGKILKE